jgi:AraC-like DNA-binding protein
MAKSPPPPVHFDIRDPDQFAHRIGELGTVASAETLMRHAEAYIESRLTRSFSPADVANQTGVSYRTLRRWFQRKWGMGPAAFHKRRRLEAVERVLLGETRDSTTVSNVAFDHGFWHLGHFCADYKRTFGETPSTTLGPTGRIHGETFGDPTDA